MILCAYTYIYCSYDVILPHFKAAAASRDWDNYYLRGTFTRYNKDFFEDIKHMIEEGFSLVSEEPVVADPGQSYAFREEDLPELYRQYEKLARYYVEKERAGEPFLFFHFKSGFGPGALPAETAFRLRCRTMSIWLWLRRERCIPVISSWAIPILSWECEGGGKKAGNWAELSP